MEDETLGILASGRGSNFESILEHVEMDILTNVEVGCLVSDNPQARALKVAESRGIHSETVDAENLRDRKEYEIRINKIFKEKGVTLIVLAGFMRIVSPYLIEKYRHKIMNIHPALLPSFKGLNAQKKALKYGVKVSGCTVHYAEEDVDAGEIILQKSVPVKENDTVSTLSDRILIFEHRTYPKAIQLHADGRIEIEDGRTRIDYSGDWEKKWDKRQKKFIEQQRKAWKDKKVYKDVFE